jgi:uncharacterized repeat protein (TIGR01451 family)
MSLLRRRAFVLPLVVTFILVGSAIAATVIAVCIPGTSYSVTFSGPPPVANWTDTSGALWSPAGGFPGCATGDSATNNSGTTLVVNSVIPNPIVGLNMGCPSCIIQIQSGGQLTLAGSGSLSSSATINVAPGGTLTIANGGNLTFNNGSALNVIGGYVDVQSGGQLTLASASTISSSGTINVSGSMTVNAPLTIQNGSQLTLGGATVDGSSSIENSGTVSQSGSNSSVTATLNNNSGGNVHVYSGTLSLTNNGTGDAPFTIDSGAVLDFPGGSYSMTANGTVSGGGTLQVSGGSLTIGGVTSPNGFTMTSGLLQGAGFLTANAMTWSGGTISGSGGTQINGGGTGNFDASLGDLILDGRPFNDYGYVNYTATSNAMYLTNDATFSVYGTFDIQADGSIEDGGAGGMFNVAPNGFLIKSGGTGKSTIFTPSQNTNTVLVASGNLEFAGNGSHNGAFFTNSGTTLTFSAPSTTLSGFIAGDGTFAFPSGRTDLTGQYAVDGLTSITGGTVTVGSSASTTDFLLTSGTLNLQSAFDMYGTGTWSGGSMTGSLLLADASSQGVRSTARGTGSRRHGGAKTSRFPATSKSTSGIFYVDTGATLTIDAATSNTVLASEIENDGTIDYTATTNQLVLSNGYVDDYGLFDVKTDQSIVNGVILAGSSSVRTSAILAGLNFIDVESGATFQKSAAAGTSGIEPTFTNFGGSVLALSGTMNFTDFEQDDGVTTLGPGSIASPATLVFLGGTLNGAGTATGDVSNGGTVAPGSGASNPATITITGNYTQTTGGALTQEIGGTTSYDKLAVGGTATLDGTLNVSLINGFIPTNGNTFPVLTFASRNGDFAVKNLPTFSGTHGSFTASYTPTELDLTAVVTANQFDLYPLVTGPATVNAGNALSYIVTISNNGPDPTGGTTTVTDTLPAGATAATGSGTGWSCGAASGGVITCTSTDVITGDSSYPALTISMTAPASGGSVSDSVTVSNAGDPNGANNSASASTTVIPEADLQVVKTGPGGVTAGQNITYTITVTNNGPSTATAVQVSDPPPANATFVSNSGACTSTYPCSLGSLASGQTATITSTYSTSPTFSGNISNTATVSSTTNDPNNTNDSSTATTNVGAQADLSINKTGPASANVGQNVVYTITFTNAGPSPATGVVISDPTPVGVAFLSNSGACSTPFPCAIGTLNAGQSGTITSTYTIPGSYTGASVTNTATISANENDPSGTNNTSAVTTTVGQPADVSITKTGPSFATPGQNVTYTITVSNAGPAAAAAVTVTDPTPAGMTFVSNTGACTTVFPCSLGTLNAGQTATINATFNIPANATAVSFTNTATVSSGATDPTPANNTASATTSVVQQADVATSKVGPATVAKGQNIVYVSTITNNGPLSAANVFVTDATPAGLTFVSNTGACTGAFPCALGTLASGQSVTITSTYNVPSNYTGTSIANTANVSSSTFDGTTANNSSTATTAIAPPTPSADLSVAKTGPFEATAAGHVTFNIFVTNLGPTAATNVVVTDPTPSALASPALSGACSAFPCTIPSMTPGTTLTITVTYTIPSQTHGTVTNTAHVTSSTPDANTSNNNSSASVFVHPFVSCPGLPPQLNTPAANATVAAPITFNWGSVPGATTYTLTVSGGSTPPVVTTIATTSATLNLISGQYSWTVSASGSPACLPVTSDARALTVCNPPAAPVASAVGELTTGQSYTVQWTSLSDASGYELQEATEPTFASPASFTGSAASKTFTRNAQTAASYFYRVRALSACAQPGPFSRTVAVVVLPLPDPNDHNPNVDVPNGSKDPVTFQVRIPGLPGGTTSFVATVDKPWLSVTPTSGLVPPEGTLVTISTDPSTLTNGTWTGTLLIVYGNSTVTSSRAHTTATTTTAVPISISLVTPVTPGNFASPASNALIIPSVGHLAGASSLDSWRSDIRVANTSLAPQNYLLTYNAGTAASPNVKQTTIGVSPGGTTALDDIVKNWFGVGSLGDSANGILSIQQLGNVAQSPTTQSFVSSRVYNATPTGTFGQFIPATPFGSFIGLGAQVLSLQQLAQSSSFHTNLGLVEASGKSVSALVSVFDGGGSKLLDLPVTVAGGEQKQLNSFLAQNGISSLDNGRVEVKVVSGEGRLTTYASVIDSNTSDPLLVSGVPLGGAGSTRFVIPGVAALDTGLANWRSDVRIFNSSNAPQTTTVTLFPLGGGNALTQSITVNPGEVKALDNVVQSVFGASNLGGALHVTTTTATPLVVTARTYDQTTHGTLGQFVPAVTAVDSPGLNGRTLQILQAEDSPRYRTNLGIAEVSGNPAIVEIAVALPDSRVTPKIQLNLGAYESTQLPIISSLGLGATYNARISVRVIAGDGKVTAYGSVVDMTTQDATYIPAQ